MRLIVLPIFVLLVAACSKPQAPPPPEPKTPLQRACAWLWDQQAEDGGWHSDTYGLMRSGQSLTPFVLHTLILVDPERAPRPDGGIERGLEFIRKNTDDEGCLGRADPDIADYPNHATSYAVRCLVAGRHDSDRALIKRMCAYLLAQQFNAGREIEPSSPRWGGWGFGSTGHPGVMDVGHTRHALEALRDAGMLDAATGERAQAFLRMVQRHPDEWRPQPEIEGGGEPGGTYDGGFYFSPVDVGMNKGRHQPAADGHASYWRSYATATCDGLLSLLAAGVDKSDERVKAAAQWLSDRPALDNPPGIPQDDLTPWFQAVHYYHLAVRAEAWAAINHAGVWRENMHAHLATLQHEDGSFVNARSPLMKENDPILCTALATIALSR